MRLTSLPFNPKPPTVMHVDLNSCFASIEQQADPHLRNKPIAVAAYDSPGGCIVAPSVEAKTYGVKVGMRVKDGKQLCPDLIVLAPDPGKYRAVHLGLKAVLGSYTDKIAAKSIDEFVLDLEGSPSFRHGMLHIGQEIKRRIRAEVGDSLRVSIGIGPNRFLAKTAAGLHKPDGLDQIDSSNYMATYMGLKLDDLCGIAANNMVRLNNRGIFSVVDFYQSDLQTLKAVFESVCGYYWYVRLHGFEIDDVEFGRKSYGNSYSIPTTVITPEEYAPILCKLVEKMSARMRTAGFRARGVHVGMLYKDGTHWHRGAVQPDLVFDARDIYKAALKIAMHSPYKTAIHTLAVSCFDLVKWDYTQLALFEDIQKKEQFVNAVDSVNERWGRYVITPARMLGTESNVPDRIAFGGVKELEEIVLHESL